MHVWLIEMNTTDHKSTGAKTYYMYGSGLIAVPHARISEFPRLKAEFHSEEVRKGMMLAWSRKPA